MRRLLLLIPGLLVVAVLAVSALTATSARADNGPHIKGAGATADRCAECHRAHRGVAEPLLAEDQADLCATCHGNAAPGSDLNVMAGTNEATSGPLRGGGFQTARINSTDSTLSIAKVGTAESGAQCWNGTDDDADTVADDGCPVTIGALSAGGAQPTLSSHSIDASGQDIWGYGDISVSSNAGLAGFGLACGKCHDPHGSGNYRILRTTPAGLLSYGVPRPAWMPDLTGKLADETPTKNYNVPTSLTAAGNIYDYWTAQNYTDRWVDSTLPVDVVDTETTGRQVGVWCGTCHTRYLAQTGSYDTDSGDAIFKFRHTTYPCPSVTGVWSAGDPAGAECRHASGTTVPTNPVTLSGSCLKCHVSHGSNASAGAYSGAEEWPGSAITVPATAPYPAAVGPPETPVQCKNNLDDDSDGTVNDGCSATNNRLLRMDNRGICQKCHNK